MKITCLVFVLIYSVALMRGTSYAASLNPASQQSSSESVANTVGGQPQDARRGARFEEGTQIPKASDEQGDHRHASDKNRLHRTRSLTKTNHPKQLLNNGERSTPRNTMNLDQPGSPKSRGASKDAVFQNGPLHSGPSAGLPRAVQRGATSLSNVRHRGPNAPIVGGMGSSHTRNTGAVDGSRMNRKP